ncbi:hypothetical protein FQN60_017196, partial [Etheostoma spectabile]
MNLKWSMLLLHVITDGGKLSALQATFRVTVSSVVMLFEKLTLQLTLVPWCSAEELKVISGSDPEQRPGAVQLSVLCCPSVRGGIITVGFWVPFLFPNVTAADTLNSAYSVFVVSCFFAAILGFFVFNKEKSMLAYSTSCGPPLRSVRVTVLLTVWCDTVVMTEYSAWFFNSGHVMVGKGNPSLIHTQDQIQSRDQEQCSSVCSAVPLLEEESSLWASGSDLKEQQSISGVSREAW